MKLDRILRTPPALITLGGLVVLAVLPAVKLTSNPIFGLPGALLLLFLIFWTLAAHNAAARRLDQVAATAHRLSFVVVGAAAIALATGVTGWTPPKAIEAIIALLGALSYFLLAWLAARKMALATGGRGVGLTFALFLAIIYLPLGIWFIRRRVEAITA